MKSDQPVLDPATPDKNLAPIVTVGTPIDTSGVERIAEPVLGINRDAEDAVMTESPVAVIDTDASALIDQLYPQGYYGPIVTHHPTKSGEIKFKYAGGGGRTIFKFRGIVVLGGIIEGASEKGSIMGSHGGRMQAIDRYMDEEGYRLVGVEIYLHKIAETKDGVQTLTRFYVVELETVEVSNFEATFESMRKSSEFSGWAPSRFKATKAIIAEGMALDAKSEMLFFYILLVCCTGKRDSNNYKTLEVIVKDNTTCLNLLFPSLVRTTTNPNGTISDNMTFMVIVDFLELFGLASKSVIHIVKKNTEDIKKLEETTAKLEETSAIMDAKFDAKIANVETSMSAAIADVNTSSIAKFANVETSSNAKFNVINAKFDFMYDLFLFCFFSLLYAIGLVDEERKAEKQARIRATNKLYRDSTETKNALASTQADLDTTKEELASTNAGLDTTKNALASTQADLDKTKERLNKNAAADLKRHETLALNVDLDIHGLGSQITKNDTKQDKKMAGVAAGAAAIVAAVTK